MKRLAMLSTAVLALATAGCTPDRTPTAVPTPEGPQQTLLTGTGPITDEYASNPRPVHGAIFTTLPFGQAVNANVQYRRKIEVYLDGGPRNPNSLAAGLPNGLYVFQITDPAGKNLLSQDPARCRVVQIQDGVIMGTVPANRIPGLGATNDNWAESGSNRNRACHIPSSEADGASLAGQHDTNVDSDGGGGFTVQMMPFLDTPNPGGVYKAWITPLEVYKQKVGATAFVTALNTIPAPARGQTTGNAPDRGFANPSRQNVKTDNFKVLERPPLIEITKLIDANRDGERTGDAAYSGTPGWPVALYEPLETDFSASWKEAPATFAVPFGTDVFACERVLPGYVFSYAYVGSTKVGLEPAPPAPATDEQGNPIVCVKVSGITTATTVAVAFGNRPVQHKAKITITPQHGVNFVGYPHTLTAKLQIDRDLGSGWENVADGHKITFAIKSGPGTLPTPPECLTSGGTGECSVALNSTSAGKTTVEASSDVTVDGTPLSVKTDGLAGNDGPATKVWIDAKISITPPNATNGISEPHTFTAKVEINHGDPDAWVNAPDGLAITFAKRSGPGDFTTNPPTCQTSGGTGSCSVVLNSSVTGTTVVEASTTVNKTTVPSLPALLPSAQSLTRTTDGTLNNSGPATKVWVDGSVSWRKVDALSQPLGGATFRIWRTHDRFGDQVTPNPAPDLSVLDNTGQLGYTGRDTDARAGFFKVEALPLGTYCVKETAAPSGYELDSREDCSAVLTLTARNATIVDAFVNRIPGQSLTPGYWKNHEEVADLYLPLFLGDHRVWQTTNPSTTFFAIFAAMNCSSSSAQNAIGCLAGHLLASKLNVRNGASTCINADINAADALLSRSSQSEGLPYIGPSGTYRLREATRVEAIAIKDKLDAYNNNIGCNRR